MDDRIAALINSVVGHDCKELHRAANLVDHYQSFVELIIRKLGQEYDLEPTSEIISAFQDQILPDQIIHLHIEKLAHFQEKLSKMLQGTDKALQQIVRDLFKVQCLQQLNHHLKIIQDIQEISHSLTTAIQGKDEAKMVNIFLTLFEDNDCENSVIGRLKDIQASRLKLFAINIAIYWHKLLSDKFASNIKHILQFS